MKLRFRNNSIRLRVNRAEVENLAAGAALQERIEFPGNAQIAYILQPADHSVGAEASFQNGVIRISAPQDQVRAWAQSDDIGLYFELPANGVPLQIAIEKDLVCVDGPPDEIDPLAFPRVVRKNC